MVLMLGLRATDVYRGTVAHTEHFWDRPKGRLNHQVAGGVFGLCVVSGVVNVWQRARSEGSLKLIMLVCRG